MVSAHAVMGVNSVEQLIPFLRWQRRLRTCQRDPGDAWPRHGIFRRELLFLVRDGGDLDCLEGLRLAERDNLGGANRLA